MVPGVVCACVSSGTVARAPSPYWLGLAALLLAGIRLSTVSDAKAEERAYRAARPCGTAVTVDCLRSVQATVHGTEIGHAVARTLGYAATGLLARLKKRGQVAPTGWGRERPPAGQRGGLVAGPRLI